MPSLSSRVGRPIPFLNGVFAQFRYDTVYKMGSMKLAVDFSIWNTYATTRLDLFLTQCLGESRTTIKGLFASDAIRVSGHAEKPSQAPKLRSVITLTGYCPTFQRRLVPSPHMAIPILHSDDAIVVINKPRGTCVNAVHHTDTNTIVNFLLAYDPVITSWDTRPLESGLVHRLDQWTSGCLVTVRTPEAYSYVKSQFQKRRITKIYLAWVEGIVPHTEVWNDLLIHDPKNPRKMKVIPSYAPNSLLAHAREARMQIEPLRYFGERYTLLRVHLHTGRMHQIRVQSAHRKHPIVGDILYGAKPSHLLAQGFALHAHILAFRHPITHHPMVFRAPLPTPLHDLLVHVP